MLRGRRPAATLVFAFAIWCATSLTAIAAGDVSPLETSRQAIVVTTPEWNATTGTLQRFERNGDKWNRVGAPVAVVIGRSGLGWGRGLQAHTASPV